MSEKKESSVDLEVIEEALLKNIFGGEHSSEDCECYGNDDCYICDDCTGTGYPERARKLQ
ncbi:MAG TPA: hypothetical protein VL995_10030 [Cellvibrio sp.]|nr:hypothetical protein [Cellvibrio sp.]